MTRRLKPRATSALVVERPPVVSDLTAPAIVGLEARPFREFLREHGVPHARVGQRVLARLEHILSAIDRLAAVGTEVPGAADDEPTADQLLARIGRVRTGGSR